MLGDRAGGLGGKASSLQRGIDVAWVFAVVGGEVHEAVALEGAVDRGVGGVGRELLVVYSDAVAGGVGIGEHSGLEHCFFVSGVSWMCILVDVKGVLGSAEGAMPGTMVEGEKEACSISAK